MNESSATSEAALNARKSRRPDTNPTDLLHPNYYGLDIRIRTGLEGNGNASHRPRTAYRDRATDTVGARLGSNDSAAPDDPGPSTGADRESASAAAEKDNLGGHHKQSEGKQECKELRV